MCAKTLTAKDGNDTNLIRWNFRSTSEKENKHTTCTVTAMYLFAVIRISFKTRAFLEKKIDI